MVLLSLLPLVLLPVMANQEMDRSQVRKTIFCGIQYNHATSACVLIVANENDFTVVSVSVAVELGNPDGVIETKTITVKRIKGNRFHVSRFKPKRNLGPVAIVEAKAFSANALRKETPSRSVGTLEECRKKSRMLFRSFFKELDFALRDQGVSKDDRSTFYVILQFAVLKFKGKSEERADFASLAESWIDKKTRAHKRKAAKEKKLLDRIRSSPKTIRSLLTGSDAVASAKIKASLLGRSVAWSGTVTRVVASGRSTHELELSCDGVTVDVDMLYEDDRLPRLGEDVRVRGTIETIEEYGMSGPTIRLSRCQIDRL